MPHMTPAELDEFVVTYIRKSNLSGGSLLLGQGLLDFALLGSSNHLTYIANDFARQVDEENANRETAESLSAVIEFVVPLVTAKVLARVRRTRSARYRTCAGAHYARAPKAAFIIDGTTPSCKRHLPGLLSGGTGTHGLVVLRPEVEAIIGPVTDAAWRKVPPRKGSVYLSSLDYGSAPLEPK